MLSKNIIGGAVAPSAPLAQPPLNVYIYKNHEFIKGFNYRRAYLLFHAFQAAHCMGNSSLHLDDLNER